MKAAALVALLLGVALVALIPGAHARRQLSEQEEQTHERHLKKLHWFYNNNMDDAAAVRSKLGPFGTSPEYMARVNNVMSVFCDDPYFKGWYARAGPDGSAAAALVAQKKAIPSTPLNLSNPNAFATLSVLQVYRDFLPGFIFINSSQHFVGMENVEFNVDDDGVVRAEFNATLRQLFNQGPATPANPNGVLGESLGRYNNKFRLMDPPGQGLKNARWCMEEFNANTQFAPFWGPGYALGVQMANTNYMGGDTRPELRE